MNMKVKCVAIAALAALLAGCVSTGPRYDGPRGPAVDQSRPVRPARPAGPARPHDVGPQSGIRSDARGGPGAGPHTAATPKPGQHNAGPQLGVKPQPGAPHNAGPQGGVKP
jgi:hypothetical protein